MYEVFDDLMKQKGVTATDVSKATGIARSNFTDWKMGRATPKIDKLQKIAEYFDVPLETFTSKRKPDVVFHAHNSSRFTPHLNFDKSKIMKEVSDVLNKTIPEVKGYPVYYSDPETAAIAQKLFEDPDYRVLFDAAYDSKPEDLKLAAEMLKRFKESNPNG